MLRTQPDFGGASKKKSSNQSPFFTFFFIFITITYPFYFLVSLPSDSYYCDIEDAIIHLIVRLKIGKDDLLDKIKNNNLIQNPSNLRGFSCAQCETLDTNKDADIKQHMIDECNIRDKLERENNLICFCRGCQVKYAILNIGFKSND